MRICVFIYFPFIIILVFVLHNITLYVQIQNTATTDCFIWTAYIKSWSLLFLGADDFVIEQKKKKGIEPEPTKYLKAHCSAK